MNEFEGKRGDIFYANIGKDLNNIRPVMIIKSDNIEGDSSVAIVAAITSVIKKPQIKSHIKLSSQISGLENDSIILLEWMEKIKKDNLIKKIGRANKEVIDLIEDIVGIRQEENIKKLEEYINQLTKPLVITEGKTDVALIEAAWEKLYPNKEMPFQCEAAGIEVEPEKRQGGAECVRRTIEFLANVTDRAIIGLFDNDREGNAKFSGANKKIFEEYNITKTLRKHISKNIWAMLLPVPDERKIFVTEDDIELRFFVIEHYFSDEVLKEYGMYGDNILGTSVFKIQGGKDNFSKKVKELLDAKEFKNFNILFKEIDKIFKSI